MTDVLTGEEGEEEYYSNFGMDASPKVFYGCKKALKTFDRVICEDVYDFVNEFQEANEEII